MLQGSVLQSFRRFTQLYSLQKTSENVSLQISTKCLKKVKCVHTHLVCVHPINFVTESNLVMFDLSPSMCGFWFQTWSYICSLKYSSKFMFYETSKTLIVFSVTCIIMKSMKSKQTHFSSWLPCVLCEYSRNSPLPWFSENMHSFPVSASTVPLPLNSCVSIFSLWSFRPLGYIYQSKINILKLSISSNEFTDVNVQL